VTQASSLLVTNKRKTAALESKVLGLGDECRRSQDDIQQEIGLKSKIDSAEDSSL
jgi:hypothetical protein